MRRTVPHLATDTLWYSAGGVVGKAMALLSVPFLTRALGPDDYGLVDLFTATAGLLTVVAMFAADIPASRLAAFADTVDDRRRGYTEYIVAVGSVSLAIAITLMFLADFIANEVWSAPGAGSLVTLAATLIPISGARAALATLHRLEGNSRRFAMLATLDVVAQLVFAVALVWIGLGPLGAVLGFVAGGSVALAVTIAMSYRLLAMSFQPRAVAGLISAGAPFLPPLVAFVAADFVARAMVADSLGQAAVGEFGLAIRIASVLALLTAAFQLAWSPRAAAMTVSVETSRRFGRTLVGYTICSGLICVALVSVAPEVVQLVAGAAFGGAATVLPALAFAAVLAGTHFILSMGTVVHGGAWMVAASSIAGAIVEILVAAISIGSIGLWAVGIAAIAGRAVSVTLLGSRVAPAFGGRLVSASAVLATVAAACLLVGLATMRPAESLPIRAVVGLVASAALVVFVVKLPKLAGKVSA